MATEIDETLPHLLLALQADEESHMSNEDASQLRIGTWGWRSDDAGSFALNSELQQTCILHQNCNNSGPNDEQYPTSRVIFRFCF